MSKTLFAVTKRFKKKKTKQTKNIKYTKSKKRIHVESEQIEIQLVFLQVESTIHSYQQQLTNSPVVKLSSIAKTSDSQSYIKKNIKRKKTQTIKRRKFRNIFNKTISVSLIKLNFYINQKIFDNNSESETIKLILQISEVACCILFVVFYLSIFYSRTCFSKFWNKNKIYLSSKTATKANNTTILERQSKVFKTETASAEKKENKIYI